MRERVAFQQCTTCGRRGRLNIRSHARAVVRENAKPPPSSPEHCRSGASRDRLSEDLTTVMFVRMAMRTRPPAILVVLLPARISEAISRPSAPARWLTAHIRTCRRSHGHDFVRAQPAAAVMRLAITRVCSRETRTSSPSAVTARSSPGFSRRMISGGAESAAKGSIAPERTSTPTRY